MALFNRLFYNNIPKALKLLNKRSFQYSTAYSLSIAITSPIQPTFQSTNPSILAHSQSQSQSQSQTSFSFYNSKHTMSTETDPIVPPISNTAEINISTNQTQTNTTMTDPDHSNNDNNTESTTLHGDHHSKVIILGSGPAGLTSALYTSRANLSPIILEGDQAGGQLTTTSEVENYPGFPSGIDGYELIMNMRDQAEKFGAIYKQEHCIEVDFNSNPKIIKTHNNTYYGDTIIISTGASAKYLGIKNELALIGHGVSACATCDGWFFRDKIVAVIGGGDSACEEATFLTKFAKKVIMIHRRNTFRASKIMQDRALSNNKIEILWNTIITDVIGNKETGVEKLKIKKVNNENKNEEEDLIVDGLFLAIGHTPNTEPFKNYLKLDKNGYIIVDPGTVNTNINGVFACGDVQDTKYKQAVTAAGTGCMAAMDAEKYLENMEQEEKLKQKGKEINAK